MQTIQIQIEDSFYDDILKHGIDIQKEFNKMVKRLPILKKKKMLLVY